MRRRYVHNLDATPVKVSSDGKFAAYHFYNGLGAPCFVQFFDKAAITDVTPGTTVPDMVLAVPANGIVEQMSSFDGYEFRLGVVVICTTNAQNGTAPSWSSGVQTGEFNFGFQ